MIIDNSVRGDLKPIFTGPPCMLQRWTSCKNLMLCVHQPKYTGLWITAMT